MKKLKVVAILLALFGMQRLNAQILTAPYLIYNSQDCDITVFLELTDCSGNLQHTTPIIPPHTWYTVPFGSVGEDLFIWLKEIASVDVCGGGSNMYAVNTPGGCWGGPNYLTGCPINLVPPATLSFTCFHTGTYTMDANGSYCRISY